MSRYIDADELKEVYKPYAERKLSVPVDVILLNIDDMPTVDAVEVVRCEDCRCSESTSTSGLFWCTVHEEPIADICYCSYGRKRDEVEE